MTRGVIEVSWQLVVIVAVGFSAVMWIAAAMWASAAKRRDAERSGRGRRVSGGRAAER
ncbi:MAG TPA: hypothetical protein VI248_29320 [Kineosporiaceae bacterium]